MNLAELIEGFRIAANDKVQPYFWSDEEVTMFLNSAQKRAAIRGRLIYEAADTDMCVINVVAGQSIYSIHPLVYELAYIGLHGAGQEPEQLRIKSPEEMNRLAPHWRERKGKPEFAVQADKWLRLAPTPDKDYTIKLEAYRLPETLLLADKETDSPEINAAHHEHLIQWALHCAYSIPDTEVFDQARAAIAEEKFDRYFGLPTDSDMRRITREDEVKRVQPFWP